MTKQEVLLDTRGHCFLCLKSSDGQILEKQSLLYFLDPNHYLNLKLGSDVKDSSDWNSSDVKGNLCEDCGKISEKISKLFLQFLEVQLKLRVSLEETLEKINEGDKERKASFRMEIFQEGKEINDLVQKLWQETVQRCREISRKQIHPWIRLERIKKADIKPVTVATDPLMDLEVEFDISQDEMSKGPVIVSTCSFSSEESGLENLLETSIPIDRNTCRVCSLTFYNQTELREHIKGAHDGRGHPCQDCGGLYTNYKYLYNHKRKCTGILQKTKFNCLICVEAFRNTMDLSKHRKEKHQGMKYKCDWCLKLFPSKPVMKVHQAKSCRGNTLFIQEPQPIFVPKIKEGVKPGENFQTYAIVSEVDNGMGVEMKCFGGAEEEGCLDELVTGI